MPPDITSDETFFQVEKLKLLLIMLNGIKIKKLLVHSTSASLVPLVISFTSKFILSGPI